MPHRTGVTTASDRIDIQGAAVPRATAAGGALLWFDARFPGVHTGAAASPSQLARLRVLLVDDCPLLTMATRSLLAGWHIAPTLATSGEDAVLRARDGNHDVVLMDVQMPGMDGFEAARAIRAERRSRGLDRPLAIVAYTASADRIQVDTLQRHGMTALLRKPCAASDMAVCLSRCRVAPDPGQTE